MTIVKVQVQHGVMHTVLGVILVSIALAYLTVLTIQICKRRGANEDSYAFECTDKSGYTDLSESDSDRILRRHDLEFVSESNTVPNTWSYTESQLQMPNQSIDSKELTINQLLAKSEDPLSASAMPPIHYGSQINYIVKEKEQVSDDYGCEVRQP